MYVKTLCLHCQPLLRFSSRHFALMHALPYLEKASNLGAAKWQAVAGLALCNCLPLITHILRATLQPLQGQHRVINEIHLAVSIKIGDIRADSSGPEPVIAEGLKSRIINRAGLA